MGTSAYDKEPGFWDRETKRIQSDFLCRPHVLRLLGNVKGKSVIDIGCGEGYLSRKLARAGATVTGVDISKSLILLAKERERQRPLGISYSVGSAQRLARVPTASQDAAISVLVYNCFANGTQWDSALRETHRIIKPDGRFVLALPHPFDVLGVSTGWVRYDRQDEEYWSTKAVSKRLVDVGGASFPIKNYHHPLEFIISKVVTNGFSIANILEPRPTAQDLAVQPKRWTAEKRLPYYLLLDLRKA